MKLSEAIRKGATLRPQAYVDFVFKDNDGSIYTCALGAAFEAICGYLPPSVDDDVPAADIVRAGLQSEVQDFNHITGCYAECPYGCRPSNPVTIIDLVPHLNDCHVCTREEIADWLEQQGC